MTEPERSGEAPASGLYSTTVTESVAGTVVRATIQNRPVSFFVTTELDTIMGEHSGGLFYEVEELDIISAHVRRGSVMLDVGANVGNHTIYAVTFLGARRVICVEPNPEAAAILRINVERNRLHAHVDLHLGVALSDRPGTAVVSRTIEMNLGGVTLARQAGGPIRLVAGDELLGGERVDFIKIDVEGMELEVLRGLRRTIETCRPAILAEVDDTTADSFHAFADELDYVVVDRVDYGYDGVENVMIVPSEQTRGRRH